MLVLEFELKEKSNLIEMSTKILDEKSIDPNVVLSAVGIRTIWNLICKIFFRLFHFVLNGLVLRHIDGNLLGIANVRLQLLYTTILFLSRESFRRTIPKFTDSTSLQRYINLIWLIYPSSLLIISIALPLTLFFQTDRAEFYPYYYHGCLFYALAAFIELLSEPFYLLASMTYHYQLNIFIEMFASTIGFSLQSYLIYHHRSSALYYYGLGYLIYSSLILFFYLIYFLSRRKENREKIFRIRSLNELFFRCQNRSFDENLFNETKTFFKQGIWMKILTEGERYLMSLFHLVSYKDQGIYDVINNLGSLIPRLVFSTFEDSAYTYFQQTLPRRNRNDKEKLSSDQQTTILNALKFFIYFLRLSIIFSLFVVTFGIPYSRFLLNLYGGSTLSEGSAPSLFQFYLIYLFFLAFNGLTEAFAQATRSTNEINEYNLFISKIVFIYLLIVYLFVRSIGIHGIIFANCLNMISRILINSWYIYQYIIEKLPRYSWKEFHLFSLKYLCLFVISFFICLISEQWFESSTSHFSFGVCLGLMMIFITWRNEKEMIHYLCCVIRLRKTKKSS